MNCRCLSALTVVGFAAILSGPSLALAQTSPTLPVVGSYSVLGHTTVTNTGATTMPGDLGISIGGAPTGFPPGSVGPPGTIRNAADSLAAQNDNTAAYGNLSGQTCTTDYGGVTVDLTTVSPLGPGVYCANAFTLTGNLTLQGSGVWIFKSAASLVTSSGSSVTGGDPCNVWWRVGSSATLGSTTNFIGNILALASISLNTGATLNGRALAQTGQVSMDTNTITGAVCLAAPVPTLPKWAILALMALLAMAGFTAMRRRAV